MKPDDLKVNQLIDIEIENKDLTLERLPSRVEEIRKPYLVVSMPMRHGAIRPLPVGQEVLIITVVKSGFFAARTRVLGRERDPIPVLILEMPREFKKIGQRRQYVRLEINLDVEFTLSDVVDAGLIKGTTSDISGGGIFLISSIDMDLGQCIDLRLFLGESDIIECRGMVVRRERDPDKSRVFWAGVKFIDIDEKQRDRIFNFIFAKQREWIKKGLL